MEIEMGGAYIVWGIYEMHTKFWLENLKGTLHLGMYRKIILECILEEIVWEVVDFMHLARDRGPVADL
jgi:hypothetical protein